MSLLPHLVNEIFEDSSLPFHYCPHTSLRNRFLPASLTKKYFRPWRHNRNKNNGTSSINVDKTKFEVVLGMHHFQPSEITVKVIDSDIVIEGKHEEKEDEHGFVSRQFSRRYSLPKDASADDVTATFSSDGFLTVTAPRKDTADTKERAVEIQRIDEPQQKKSDSLTSLKSFTINEKSSKTSIPQ